MSIDDLRPLLERLLDLAHEQLDDQGRDRLRSAVEQRHGDWFE
jgi:hypothetical protein